MFETIIWKNENNIGHLILNSPPSNKMSTKFFCELYELTENIIPEENIKTILIYGEGRHFSYGADINELLLNISNNFVIENNIKKYPDFLFKNNKVFLFFSKIDIPVISVIKGVCLGSAFEFTLFSDIRLCAENSLIGLPETTFNLIPGCGGISKLYNIAGYSKSLEFILTGENIPLDQALKYNIIHKIINKKEILNYAFNLADDIKNNYTKKNIYEIIEKIK